MSVGEPPRTFATCFSRRRGSICPIWPICKTDAAPPTRSAAPQVLLLLASVFALSHAAGARARVSSPKPRFWPAGGSFAAVGYEGTPGAAYLNELIGTIGYGASKAPSSL